MRAESSGESRVFEISCAHIVIERGRVAGKIRFDDIEVAVEIKIRGGDSHACLWLAIWAQGASGFDRNVFELAVFLVVIKRARR